MEDRHKHIALFILLLIFAYISYRIISPFLTYSIMGLLLAFLMFPLYGWLRRRMSGSLAAISCMIIVLLVIILPSIWIWATLLIQAQNTYQSVQAAGVTFESIAERIPGVEAADIQAYFTPGRYAAALPRIISVTGEFIVGMLVLFLVMYYALKEGERWFSAASRLIPIRKEYKRRLQDDIEQMTRALFYGQVLTSIIIGAAVGVLFWLFGIPNAVFWGFLMAVLAFLPVLGAPIIYVPAGIILIVNGAVFSGIMLIALGTLVIFAAEYIIRPKFVSRSAALHPLTVIIGALGGAYVLGFIGFLIGPLILGIFLTMLSFDFSPEEEAKPSKKSA